MKVIRAVGDEMWKWGIVGEPVYMRHELLITLLTLLARVSNS